MIDVTFVLDGTDLLVSATDPWLFLERSSQKIFLHTEVLMRSTAWTARRKLKVNIFSGAKIVTLRKDKITGLINISQLLSS